MSANVNTTVNNTQLSSCFSPDNPTAEKIGKAFAYCTITVISLVGNSFIGIIVYKTKTMRKTINFLIVNMAMSDLLFPIFVLPWSLTEIFVGSWLISGHLGLVLCKLVSFSTMVSFGVSIQSLILIAVDRFGAVVFPLRSPLISSKLCRFFILATWIIAIAVLCPYLFAYKLVEYPKKLSCEQQWNEAFGNSSSFVVQKYFLALSVIEICIPFALISVLYAIILIKLKKQKIPGAQSLSAEKQRAKRHRNVLKMAIAIVLGFAVCLGPFSVFIVRSTIVWDHTACNVMRYVFIAQVFAHSNCAINPCICFIFSGSYRQGLRNLFNPLLCRTFKVNLSHAM